MIEMLPAFPCPLVFAERAAPEFIESDPAIIEMSPAFPAHDEPAVHDKDAVMVAAASTRTSFAWM